LSFLGDALSFESFHAKDLWDRIKKDPKRLVLGVDPLSTKAWNAVLGRKDEPLVDQLGGAYGGHTISAFGNNDGGVYARAEAAGVPTSAGKDMQNAAHVISAIYGGQGVSNIGAGNMGGLGNGGSGIKGPFQGGGMFGQLTGNKGGQVNPMWGQQGQTIPGISGNVSTGSGIYGSGWGQGAAQQGGFMSQVGGTKGLLGMGQGLAQVPGVAPQQQEQAGPKPYLYKGQIVWM
jgi:hypothetical protein